MGTRRIRGTFAALAVGAAVIGGLVPARPARAAFPGKNGRLAFARINAGQDSAGIFTMNPDGTGVVQVTTTNDFDPAWSPDGTKIAFDSLRDGNSEIYVMNADGTGQKRLTNDPAGQPAAVDNGPKWSPDGANIVFMHDSAIDVMKADGTGVTQLSATGNAPVWAPDGSKIAFADSRDRNAIYLMNPDGSGVVRATAGGDPQTATADSLPDWAPDSKRIVFGTGGSACSQRIAVVDVATGAQHDITSGRCNDTGPTWSPDGTMIAFETENPAGAYVANADGTGIHQIDPNTTDSVDDWQASGSPAPNNPQPTFTPPPGAAPSPSAIPSAPPAPIITRQPRFTG